MDIPRKPPPIQTPRAHTPQGVLRARAACRGPAPRAMSSRWVLAGAAGWSAGAVFFFSDRLSDAILQSSVKWVQRRWAEARSSPLGGSLPSSAALTLMIVPSFRDEDAEGVLPRDDSGWEARGDSRLRDLVFPGLVDPTATLQPLVKVRHFIGDLFSGGNGATSAGGAAMAAGPNAFCESVLRAALDGEEEAPLLVLRDVTGAALSEKASGGALEWALRMAKQGRLRVALVSRDTTVHVDVAGAWCCACGEPADAEAVGEGGPRELLVYRMADADAAGSLREHLRRIVHQAAADAM